MPIHIRFDSSHRLILAVFAALLGSAAFGADESPVATIGKQTVLPQEFNARTSAKLSALQSNYESTLRRINHSYARDRQSLNERELNAMLDEKVLELEAASKKSTPDALKLAVKVPEVADTQVHGFFDANKGQMQQPFEQMATPIKQYLQKQAHEDAQRAYLATLRSKYNVTVNLAPFREPVAAIGPQRGPDDAPITMVEFSDFQCPFCGRFSPVVKEVLAKYPTKVRLFYRHLPLASLHPNAQKAAEAAVCAQAQGKFWEMHDLMFAEQSTLAEDALKEKAKRLGLDSKAFDECLTGGKARDAVQKDVDAAEQLGIGGTPFSFINGRYVDGAASAQDLSTLIEDELRRAELQTAAPKVRR